MLYLIYAESGKGKSEVKTAFAEPFLRNSSEINMDTKGYFQFLSISPKDRLKMCYARISSLNSTREKKLSYPEHLVQSNEAVWTTKHGRFIKNYDMPGDKNGLFDENYETYCPPPHSLIFWDEAQKEVSGRESSSMPARVSFLCQTHRKWGLDILFFTQRSTILDLTIRDNCMILGLEDVVHKYDKYGFITGAEYKFKVFFKLKDLERYLSTDKKTYKKTSYIFNKNARKHYDTNEGEEHYIYHADKCGLNLRQRPERDNSLDNIAEYVKENPYTPPLHYRKISQAELRKLEKEKQKQKEK